jgi:hypothetical protein
LCNYKQENVMMDGFCPRRKEHYFHEGCTDNSTRNTLLLAVLLEDLSFNIRPKFGEDGSRRAEHHTDTGPGKH